MTREGATAIVIAFAVLVFAAMAWGWWRRTRRDRGLVAPTDVPADASTTVSLEGFYVATTRHDAPLDRLAVKHLAFRGRARIDVTDRGVALHIPGEPTIFLTTAALVGVGRATWTIDRVVERDGLVLVAWRGADGTIADSYVRLEGADPDVLVTAIQAILPAPAAAAPPSPPPTDPAAPAVPTGSDA